MFHLEFMFDKINTTGATSVALTARPSGASELTPYF